MTFSYNKAMLLRPKKEKWLSTFFFSLLVGAVAILPYILTSSAFAAEGVSAGLDSLGMIFLSPAEIGSQYKLLLMDTFGMVLGSPLGFLGWLPEAALPYVFGGLMVLRTSLSALTAYFFIRRFVRMPETARLGAFLYAFSSAVIGVTVSGALNNGTVILPLILLAAEKLMTENKKFLLLISLFVGSLLNPYAVWSIGVFLIIYLILRLSSKDVKATAAVIFRLIAEIALGVLLAGVFLIPISFICTVNNLSYFEYIGLGALLKEGSFIEIIRAIFLPAESVNSPVALSTASASGGLFGAYLPLMSMAGVIAFCGAKKGSGFKRVVVASFVFLAVPALNSLFSIVNPNAVYSWFFAPTLIFALTSVMALENREISLSSGFKWSAFITLAVSAIILFYPNFTENGITLGLYNGAMDKAAFIRTAIYVLVAVIGLITAVVAYKMSENRSHILFNTLFFVGAVISAVELWLYTATENKFVGGSEKLSEALESVDKLYYEGLDIERLLFVSQFVTIAAFGGVLIYAIFCIATHSKRAETPVEYPEGEQLLETWQKVEEEDEFELPEEEDFSLESIAENLGNEYPVNVNKDEFAGGFNIVADISSENVDNK